MNPIIIISVGRMKASSNFKLVHECQEEEESRLNRDMLDLYSSSFRDFEIQLYSYEYDLYLDVQIINS
jgi:hypothetical protein